MVSNTIKLEIQVEGPHSLGWSAPELTEVLGAAVRAVKASPRHASMAVATDERTFIRGGGMCDPVRLPAALEPV